MEFTSFLLVDLASTINLITSLLSPTPLPDNPSFSVFAANLQPQHPVLWLVSWVEQSTSFYFTFFSYWFLSPRITGFCFLFQFFKYFWCHLNRKPSLRIQPLLIAPSPRGAFPRGPGAMRGSCIRRLTTPAPVCVSVILFYLLYCATDMTLSAGKLLKEKKMFTIIQTYW